MSFWPNSPPRRRRRSRASDTANGRVGDAANGRHGDMATWRHGDTAMQNPVTATKWLDRTAQGFSPGSGQSSWMRPESIPNRGRGVQFPIGAVFRHSNTPSLRVAGFEDEDSLGYSVMPLRASRPRAHSPFCRCAHSPTRFPTSTQSRQLPEAPGAPLRQR
jgi:hypothetical protein